MSVSIPRRPSPAAPRAAPSPAEIARRRYESIAALGREPQTPVLIGRGEAARRAALIDRVMVALQVMLWMIALASAALAVRGAWVL